MAPQTRVSCEERNGAPFDPPRLVIRRTTSRSLGSWKKRVRQERQPRTIRGHVQPERFLAPPPYQIQVPCRTGHSKSLCHRGEFGEPCKAAVARRRGRSCRVTRSIAPIHWHSCIRLVVHSYHPNEHWGTDPSSPLSKKGWMTPTQHGNGLLHDFDLMISDFGPESQVIHHSSFENLL